MHHYRAMFARYSEPYCTVSVVYAPYRPNLFDFNVAICTMQVKQEQGRGIKVEALMEPNQLGPREVVAWKN